MVVGGGDVVCGVRHSSLGSALGGCSGSTTCALELFSASTDEAVVMAVELSADTEHEAAGMVNDSEVAVLHSLQRHLYTFVSSSVEASDSLL